MSVVRKGKIGFREWEIETEGEREERRAIRIAIKRSKVKESDRERKLARKR